MATRYRLRFQGTRATKKAASLKQARKDARYWLDFGQTKVCIDRQLPSGRYTQVECKLRSRRGRR